jgi:hypothetical protein
MASKVTPIEPVASEPPKIVIECKASPRTSVTDHGGNGGGRASVVHIAVSEWRHLMIWVGWYDSAACAQIRRVIRGKYFTICTMLALFIALFFADLFVVCQVSSNTPANVILFGAFLIFLTEFIGLCITDPSYLLSFFFCMDLLGTISMIFDVPFMLGVSATESEKLSGQSGGASLLVARAARAAKLGARAGRLSRVMKLLRFLPFMSGGEQDDDVKMAKVISNQLTNVLSTRVAFLTICIVVVLPLFGMFTYPEVDDSMTAWTSLLAQNAEELKVAVDAVPQNVTAVTALTALLNKELARFATFYNAVSYGPFAVCYGQKLEDDEFQCLHSAIPALTFDSSFSAPSRVGSIRDIAEGSFRTSYDLSTPKQMESGANIGLILFIILVMVGFGLVTSSSISVIALQPLERMLSVVRARCQQIFKYTDDLNDDDDDCSDEEEYDDNEKASEFVLLEKVVQKLAAIAHLSSAKDEPEVKENMTENEVMVLNWMQGTQATAGAAKIRASERVSEATGATEASGSNAAPHFPAALACKTSIPTEQLESLKTASFNTLDLSKDLSLTVAAYIVTSFEGSREWVRTTVSDQVLQKFVATCESKYLPQSFHNFAHALDVEYSTARMMRLVQAEKFLADVTMFWVMIASVAHDLGHLAVNNQYLIETSHELALKYNDRSPLENMHCATMFQVISNPDANIFAQVERDLYKDIRKGIINAILHTDVTKHNEMMKELALLYQMNSEAFDEQRVASECSPAVVEVLQNNVQLAVNAFVHGADVGNPMKPWEMARRLAHLCVDEFFAQGDAEKAAGIPVQMLNDRDKVNRPNSQIGFIEFVILPLAEGVVHLFPALDGLAYNLGENILKWCDAWIEDAHPTPEAIAKMQGRVAKVHDRCQNSLRQRSASKNSQ